MDSKMAIVMGRTWLGIWFFPATFCKVLYVYMRNLRMKNDSKNQKLNVELESLGKATCIFLQVCWFLIRNLANFGHPTSKQSKAYIFIRERMNMLSFSKEKISISMMISLTFEKLQGKSSMIWLPSIPNSKENPAWKIQNWIDSHLKLLLTDSKNTFRHIIYVMTVIR